MKKGWEMKSLGDLCDLVTKGTTPTSVGYKFVAAGINFIKIESIDLNRNFLPEKFAAITNECHAALKRSQLRAGDILFSIAGALGRTAFVTKDILPANTNQALAIIRLKPLQTVLPEFILLTLETGIVFDQINKFKGGVAQQNLSLEQVRSFQIPLPPLAEQKRIVSILDEAFAHIAKAKANAEKNLQNARELFESYLQNVFANPGEDWEEKRLGEVCEIGDGNYSSKYPKASEFVVKGIPFLTATNLKNGTIISDGIRYISKEQHSTLTKGHIKMDDLVIVVRGSSTGNNSIVPKEYEGSNLNSQLAYLRVHKIKLSSAYLFAVFNSPNVMRKVKDAISGAAQPQLPNNKLLDISIIYPPIKEQNSIVSQLEVFSAQCRELETIYKQKIVTLDELKKSILQKAFSGELKTTDKRVLV